jgi:hypothetical protein
LIIPTPAVSKKAYLSIAKTSSRLRSLIFPRPGRTLPRHAAAHGLGSWRSGARARLTLEAIASSHRDLALENQALRQQLAVFKCRNRRPRISSADRGFWVVLHQLWDRWREALVIVKPDTVVGCRNSTERIRGGFAGFRTGS